MAKKIVKEDYIGYTYFKLTVIGIDYEKSKGRAGTFVYVKCECGTEKSISLHNLLKGETKSCGCMRGVNHNMSNHPMYKIYIHQQYRCNNPKNYVYKHYGGRGIKCIWTLEEAVEWYNNNPRPSLEYSLDRIDNDGHYEASNVRWANQQIQVNNRREIKGVTNITKRRFGASYEARITIDGKRISKSFKTEDEAKIFIEKKKEEVKKKLGLLIK